MHPDLVTNLMRQTGYLDNTYVKIPAQQKHDEFMEGQHTLFITRAVDRSAAKNTDRVKALEKENEAMKAQIKHLEQAEKDGNALRVVGAQLSPEQYERLLSQLPTAKAVGL